MRVESNRVVPVWIFARVEQHPDNFGVTKLRCQGKRAMAIVGVGARKQPASVVNASQRRRDR